MKLVTKILIGVAITGVVAYATLNVMRVIPFTAVFVNNLPVLKDIPTILNNTEKYCGTDDNTGEWVCIEVPVQDCWNIINDICYRTEEEWHNKVLADNKQHIEDGIKYCKETFGVDTYNMVLHYYNEWDEPMYSVECDLTEKYAEEHRQAQAELDALPAEKRTLLEERCRAQQGDIRHFPLHCSRFSSGVETVLFYASDL